MPDTFERLPVQAAVRIPTREVSGKRREEVPELLARFFLGELFVSLEDRVRVARLNIDEHPAIASRYSVLSIPTVMLFAGGEARGSLVGARPQAHFERWLAEVLPAAELDGVAAQRRDDA